MGASVREDRRHGSESNGRMLVPMGGLSMLQRPAEALL
jgi:hypothetical protein